MSFLPHVPSLPSNSLKALTQIPTLPTPPLGPTTHTHTHTHTRHLHNLLAKCKILVDCSSLIPQVQTGHLLGPRVPSLGPTSNSTQVLSLGCMTSSGESSHRDDRAGARCSDEGNTETPGPDQTLRGEELSGKLPEVHTVI